mgnify:CR=1 FL=1
MFIKLPQPDYSLINFYIPVGSVYEPKEVKGISHFLEHLIILRTEKNKEYFDKLGLTIYASTYKYYSYYSIEVPSYLTKKAYKIMENLIKNLKITSSDIEKEKKLIEEEIKFYEKDIEDIAFNKLCNMIFKNTPLEDPVIGYLDTIKNFNKNTLIKWHKKFYSNPIVIYSSKIKLIDKSVKDFKICPPEVDIILPSQKFLSYKIKNNKRNLFLWTLIFKENKNIKDRLVIEILSYMLGNMNSSILFQNLVMNGYVYKYRTEVTEFNGISLLLSYIHSQKLDKIKNIIFTLSKNLQKKLNSELFILAKNCLLKDIESSISKGSFTYLIGHNICTFGQFLKPSYIIEVIKNIKFSDLIKILNKNLIDYYFMEIV